MREQDIDVEVITTDPSGKLLQDEKIDEIRVRRFRSFAPQGAYYFSYKLYRYLDKHSSDYDIIHAHSYHSLTSLISALASKNNFVFTPHYHGTGHTTFRQLLHVPYRMFGKVIFRKANLVICVSNFERSVILKNFKESVSKIVIIPNGLMLQESDIIKMKKTNAKKKILCVSRLEKYKRIDRIISALPYLPAEVMLRIVGSGPDRDRLENIAMRLKVQHRVTFLGNITREHLLKEYSEANAFVLLSEHESYGISVAEALAFRVPCVVSNSSALAEFVDNKNCFGVDNPEDLLKLSKVICQALNSSVSEVKFLSWKEVSEITLNAYRMIKRNSPELD